MPSHDNLTITAHKFLKEFETAVGAGDIDSMSPFFSEGVLSYGTRTVINTDKSRLIENQWRKIWGQCESWRVISVDKQITNENGGFLAFRWERVNLDKSVTLGRATLAFEFNEELRLQVVHSHFSENPVS